MEHFHADAKEALDYISKILGIRNKSLQPYLAQQIWNPSTREQILVQLSNLLIESEKSISQKVANVLAPITAELLYRYSKKLETSEIDSKEAVDVHERICIVLSWLCVTTVPSISDFCIYYLSKHGPPFKRFSLQKQSEEQQSKKRRIEITGKSADEILEATYHLIVAYPVLLELRWPWSDLLDSCCVSSNATQRRKFFLRELLTCVFGLAAGTPQEAIEEVLRIEMECQLPVDDLDSSRLTVSTGYDVVQHTKQAFVSSDLLGFLTPVCGVLLPVRQPGKSEESSRTSNSNLIMIDSCRSQLQQLALSVADGRSVLLEGPIGCGKTALVEYLAVSTGRCKPPHLTKIQLSDDTDSKTLTGAYTCTAVPGEFVWQPGLLVEACNKGYWVLLEDIDRAPMDIISLILPLVESRHLNIPGRSSQNNFVSHQFRLFMTRRVATATAGVRNVGVDMVSKATAVLSLHPIPKQEIKQVLLHKYKNLEPLADKLLHIYQVLQAQSFNSTQRKPSTRDLLKWCHRISLHVRDFGLKDIGEFVALSALDCFVASMPKPETRLVLAELICSEVSTSSSKAAYYCQTYCPSIESAQDGNQLVVGRVSLKSSPSDSADDTKRSFSAGRKLKSTASENVVRRAKQPFAKTRHSSVLLERVACCVHTGEPVLLVGETGVGKTSALQYLAQETGHNLHVVNMSQQSSSSDLLGGYKPALLGHFVAPVKEHFERTFSVTFSRQQNSKFLTHIQNCFKQKRYNDLWQLMMHSCKAALKKCENEPLMAEAWLEVFEKLQDLKRELKSNSALAFQFVEGQLSRCLQNGDWILLDEINLASPDTLECLSSVLESESGSIVLMERGDAKPIGRHDGFRLFAAMNPATDVGKRNLPDGIRNRFTEVYVDEPRDYGDLATIVSYYIKRRSVGETSVVNGIVKFYQEARKLAAEKLADGSGHKPHYSLRTLCRALQYVVDNARMTLHKALYEGFSLAFLTALDRSSHPLVVDLIVKWIVTKAKLKEIVTQKSPPPVYPSVSVVGHHIRCGRLAPSRDQNYIITSSVKENLQDLARPVSYGKYPILIQGETSTGKTSLIRYLAALTGNKVVRINNHEHTDLQEYIGNYASDNDGRLVFQEGPLVAAMRQGHWVILDELNLAPTDILEALNRVLDDNREIFITETQEVVKAQPGFTLFATQNPPGSYGGRKILSRAFRNRFVELHFDEIPTNELQTILHQRCQLAPKHCGKLVKIMLDLQTRRRSSGLFSGKHGYVTLRDLFRWAERHRRHQRDENEFYDWEQHLADDGFLLLAGRVRKKEEEKVIEEVIAKHLGRRIDRRKLFSMDAHEKLLRHIPAEFDHVVWTRPMKMLFVTLERALRFDEPVLLVGETGGGKTTVCQMMSSLMTRKLAIINCHANTEAADFIGGLRPSRSHDNDSKMDSDGNKNIKLFEWVDGPLVESMNEGEHLLVDEISLADDSVLERLNSVLEPERSLVIADKMTVGNTGDDGSFVVAKSGFQFMSTMNPGGDFGKKELSPALRNRMTEIWCDVIHEEADLVDILTHNLRLTPFDNLEESKKNSEVYARLVVNFVTWFKSTLFGKRFVISVRDLLTWSKFMTLTCRFIDLPSCYVHAACLIYVDGLGSGVSGSFASSSRDAHVECLKFIASQLTEAEQLRVMSDSGRLWLEAEISGKADTAHRITSNDTRFGVGPYTIEKGSRDIPHDLQFTFKARTTSNNALRVIRALQLSRPVLLEGSPGGGKTSLVAAIAKSAGFRLVRINLSEQTDASDLFGEDLPVEKGVGGEFAWRDGPLLSALKAGDWIVLDELNLASQSVLESLNSIFDHRGQLYVPELGKYFNVDREKTKIFACQNPVQEGGGRKGLPKSFLNRFTQVYVENLTSDDLLLILTTSFPQLDSTVLRKMVDFNSEVHRQVVVERSWAHRGSPWEMNLRDLSRWCSLVASDVAVGKPLDVSKYVYLIYCERLRTTLDRDKMYKLYQDVFDSEAYKPTRTFHMTESTIQFGDASLQRNLSYVVSTVSKYTIPSSLMHPAESLVHALNQNWPCILTGPSGSGKSVLVKTVAALAGRKLRVLATNSAMDAIELLGGYEQCDHVVGVAESLQNAKRLISDYIIILSNDDTRTSLVTSQTPSLLKLTEELDSCADQIVSAISVDDTEKILATLRQKTQSFRHAVTRLVNDKAACQKITDALDRCLATASQKASQGTYEWIDSILVQALRGGDWLLIDDANFCLPSVLDRLNALLEPQGVLSVTERGMVDGKIIEVKPDPNFRLIFALDPLYGDLSRAMRNRCLEINVHGSDVTSSLSDFTRNEGLTLNETQSIARSKCSNSKERNFLRVMLERTDETEGNRNHDNDQQIILDKMDKMLSLNRRGLGSVANLTVDERQPFGKMVVPRVLDFMLRTKWALALRQMQFLSELQGPLECSDLESLHKRATVCSNLKIYLERSTAADWKIRLLLLEKYLPELLAHLGVKKSDAPYDIDYYVTISRSILRTIFSCDSLSKVVIEEEALKSLPWDPRWEKQLLDRNLDSKNRDFALHRLLMFQVVYLISCDQLTDFKFVTSRNKKRRLNTIPALKLAKGCHDNLLQISQLPHPVLSSLFALYDAWNCFLTSGFQKLSFTIESEQDLMQCELLLNQISSIWRYLSSKPFVLQAFILRHTHLRKVILKLGKLLVKPGENPKSFLQVQKLLERMDNDLSLRESFAGEVKLRRKLRTSLPSFFVYKTKEHCELTKFIRNLLIAMSVYCDQAFHLKQLTSLTWDAFSSAVNKVATVMFSLNRDCDISVAQQSIHDVCAELVRHNVKLPPSEFSATVENVEAVVPTLQTFGVAHLARRSWPLHLFCRLISLLNNCTTGDSNPDCAFLTSSLFSTDIANHTELVTSRSNPSRLKNYMLRCLDRVALPGDLESEEESDVPDMHSSVKSRVDHKSEIIGGRSMNPVLSCSMTSLLGAKPRASNGNKKSLDFVNLQSDLLGAYDVSIENTTKKSEQLTALHRLLWTNATSLTQISGPACTLGAQVTFSMLCLTESLTSVINDVRSSDLKAVLTGCDDFQAVCLDLSSEITSSMASCSTDCDLRLSGAFDRLLFVASDTLKIPPRVGEVSTWVARINETFENCVRGFRHLLHLVSLSNDERCSRCGAEATHQTEVEVLLWSCLGETWLWLGLFHLTLIAPRSSVDPVEMDQLQQLLIKGAIESQQLDASARNEFHRNLTGFPLTSDSEVTTGVITHPRVKATLEHFASVQDKLTRLDKRSAYRPENSSFHKLHEDCLNFMSTVASFSSVTSALQMTSSLKSSDSQCRLADSMEAFCDRLSRSYPEFPDFVEPIRMAVANQMSYGLRLSFTSTKIQLAQQVALKKATLTVEDFVMNLLDGQCLDAEIAKKLLGLEEVITNLMDLKETSRLPQLRTGILSKLLLDFHVLASSGGHFDVRRVLPILEFIVKMWTKRQEEKDQEASNKASLFKYKSEVHEGDPENEDEEIKEMFPAFDRDFRDLADVDTFDDFEMEEEKSTKKDDDSMDILFELTVLVYSKLIESNFGKTPDVHRQKDARHKHKIKAEDSLSSNATGCNSLPALFAHSLTAPIITDLFPWLLGSKIDHMLVKHHLHVITTVQDTLSDADHAADLQRKNLYVDSLPAETSRCLPVLKDFMNTIRDKLLEQWPEHPVLNQLLTIINRILSFSVHSPVMKFVQGLELLLEKAQEWETNASREVSVLPHLEALTSLILDWRRLELKTWSRLLDDACSVTDTTKWWFYLYQLVEDSIVLNKDDQKLQDVIETLQQFVESSNLVQFSKRLELLVLFHRHLVVQGCDDAVIATVLWNLHQYYKQFMSDAENRIAALRKPIEKELKNFVKIAKWNDINFYSVKESITKTHRNLFKFVKKFSASLQEPASINVLKSTTPSFEGTKAQESRGMSLVKAWERSGVVVVMTTPEPSVSVELSDILRQDEVHDPDDNLLRMTNIVPKLHKHSAKWRRDANESYPALLLGVEETTADVIEYFNVLRKLEPTTAASGDEEMKKKRISEAKHIRQRKRKALADLFKLLKSIGLSYRKGLIWNKNLAKNELMLTPNCNYERIPLVESASLDQAIHEMDLDYFYKVISRSAALAAALKSPNKELGRTEIERMSGFTNHLLRMSVEQRQNLTLVAEVNQLLSDFETSCAKLNPDQESCLPTQEGALHHLQISVKALSDWCNGLSRFSDVLRCCPRTSASDESHDDVPLLASMPRPHAAHCCHGDDTWRDVMDTVKKELDSCAEKLSHLSEELNAVARPVGGSQETKSGSFVTPALLGLSRHELQAVNHSSMTLCAKLSELFNTSSSTTTPQVSSDAFVNSPLISDVMKARSDVITACEEAGRLVTDAPRGSDRADLLAVSRSLLHSVMMSVQELCKSAQSRKEEVTEDETTENLLVEKIHERCARDMSMLRVQQVKEIMLQFVRALRDVGESEKDKTIFFKLLSSLNPVIKEYQALLRQVMSTIAMSHRSTCKLAHILSAIFAEVACKGYCPPADVEEEMTDEKGDFKEVEDAGIGEGQGKKDVSDQIEEEDQVEDTPGSEQKEDNENEEDIPAEDNAIEMTEDFEGKMHDPEKGAEQEKEDDNDEEEEENEEDLDKQMGDLGDEADADKLDERMWGSDDEEEEQEEEENKREEKGAGVDQEQSELAAKDDGMGEDRDEEEPKKENEPENLGDQSEFNPDERDDQHEQEDESRNAEDMALPDEINIDEEDADDENNEDDGGDTSENKEGNEPDEKDETQEEEDAVLPENLMKETETDEANDDATANEENEEEKNNAEEEAKEEREEETNEMEVDPPDDQLEVDADARDENEEDEEKMDEDSNVRSSGSQLPNEDHPEDEDDLEKDARDKTSSHETKPCEDSVEQNVDAMEKAAQTDAEKNGDDDQGTGLAAAADDASQSSTAKLTQKATNAQEAQQAPMENERKLGKSDSKRSLSDAKSNQVKRLRTIEYETENNDNVEEAEGQDRSADEYQHVDQGQSFDKLTLDAATEQQVKEQKLEDDDDDDDSSDDESKLNETKKRSDEDVAMETVDCDGENAPSAKDSNDAASQSVQTVMPKEEDVENIEESENAESNELQEKRDLPDSSLHTNLSQWVPNESFVPATPEQLTEARREMEKQLQQMQQDQVEALLNAFPSIPTSAKLAVLCGIFMYYRTDKTQDSERLWHQYLSLTQPLSQQLSEQLRLILEPTQAAKLKGDYRTGRRLNMRKVIPYIASGFRKDKIWMRRSKPSKRAYQIMLAMDDSSSMADNHTKQLAFESLAVISSALSTLEAGQLGVCSFGDDTKLLHDLTQPFTDQSGAAVLQRCSFAQERTKIAKLLETSVMILKAAQMGHQSAADPRIAQLLLIISDGRGLYIEGKEKVESAVRAARDCGIFVAFVILDNPNIKDSILDIKVPIFNQDGKKPEIRSYMADFPFPFYVIIRDVNALPDTLSEALRQWFELVTTGN